MAASINEPNLTRKKNSKQIDFSYRNTIAIGSATEAAAAVMLLLAHICPAMFAMIHLALYDLVARSLVRSAIYRATHS